MQEITVAITTNFFNSFLILAGIAWDCNRDAPEYRLNSPVRSTLFRFRFSYVCGIAHACTGVDQNDDTGTSDEVFPLRMQVVEEQASQSGNA